MALATTTLLAALSLCAVHAPPQVFFVYSEKAAVIHHDQSTKALGKSWQRPEAIQREFPITGGYTNGKVKADFEMQFAYQAYGAGNFCLWPGTVRVHVSYVPDVFIASDYREGGCRYKDTLAHEFRHVHTDIDTLKKYLPALENAARAEARRMEAPPPMSQSRMIRVRQEFIDRVQAAISVPLNKLDAERKEKQALIDTRQEYLRASHACVR